MLSSHKKDFIQELIDFLLSFPLPNSHQDILRKQIIGSSFSIEQYEDCFKILFTIKEKTEAFPLWFPALLQGCQILKDNGPISCQLFIENGYVVQFEIVDLGTNKIDWDYIWTHKAIFDIEYDLKHIKNQLEADVVYITTSRVYDKCVMFEIDTVCGYHTVCLYDCVIHAFPTTQRELFCKLQLYPGCNGEHKYAIASDDGNIDIVCSLICLRDGLRIN